MNIGMLWYDPDPKVSLDTKVERAASYYCNKYGRSPNICFVHPTMMASVKPDPDAPYIAGGVEVRSNRSVLPNNFWIGMRD